MKATNRMGDNEETHERLITKIYEQLTQLNTKTKNKKKWAEDISPKKTYRLTKRT